jgi:hypothetical protein
MARYSSGRFALRISDRDGQAYPYNEMVQNGQARGYILQNMNLNLLY